MPHTLPFTARRHLSADALIRGLRQRFADIPDHRHDKATISLTDALMSAFALFSLKDPSLLAFDQRRNDQNLKNLYGLRRIPCDTQMREILDEVVPDSLHVAFVDLFRRLQRGKVLKSLVFLDGHYLVALDGTGYFSSPTIHCDSCLQAKDRHGHITYSHQMVSAVIVHPDQKAVIPLGCEPIIKADGSTKNDCERNASKRLLQRLRRQHPRLKMIVVEDGLASNAPHIRELQRLGIRYLLGCKPGDHEYLFAQAEAAFEEDRFESVSWTDEDTGHEHEVTITTDLPLNESNQDVRVTLIRYTEHDERGEVVREFTWVTDLVVPRGLVRKVVRGGRARWRIENETFNTLKNQGYQFEHNFGHGHQHLSVVLALLMMLAFAVDQIQQHCCRLFQAVWAKYGSKRLLWDNLRSHVRHVTFTSFEHLYRVMLGDLAKELPAPGFDGGVVELPAVAFDSS